jgi:hypothetical protein
MAGKAVMEKLASQAYGNFRPFGTKKTNEAMDERELAELLALKPTNSLTLMSMPKIMNDPKLKF